MHLNLYKILFILQNNNKLYKVLPHTETFRTLGNVENKLLQKIYRAVVGNGFMILIFYGYSDYFKS